MPRRKTIQLSTQGRPSAEARPGTKFNWLIHTGGDCIGVAEDMGGYLRAWREGRHLGNFDTLDACAIAMMDDEDAQLAARSASRGEAA